MRGTEGGCSAVTTELISLPASCIGDRSKPRRPPSTASSGPCTRQVLNGVARSRESLTLNHVNNLEEPEGQRLAPVTVEDQQGLSRSSQHCSLAFNRSLGVPLWCRKM